MPSVSIIAQAKKYWMAADLTSSAVGLACVEPEPVRQIVANDNTEVATPATDCPNNRACMITKF